MSSGQEWNSPKTCLSFGTKSLNLWKWSDTKRLKKSKWRQTYLRNLNEINLRQKCRPYFRRKKRNCVIPSNLPWQRCSSVFSVIVMNSLNIVSKTLRDWFRETKTFWMTCWTSRHLKQSARWTTLNRLWEWQNSINCTRSTPKRNQKVWRVCLSVLRANVLRLLEQIDS